MPMLNADPTLGVKIEMGEHVPGGVHAAVHRADGAHLIHQEDRW
ncbi:MAG: hypothetical protein U5L08_14495 [Xanthomonadales bacterium]|nr:hypothetical protein [Xanthomonadales bacterium]